jgi:hypothetical protein
LASYNPDHDPSPIHAAAATWSKRCLLEDGSILQDGLQLWIPALIDELDQRVVRNFDEGEGDFFEKLKSQLGAGSAECHQLMGEILWILEHHPMAKSNPVNETRIADPVEPAKPQSRPDVKKARKLAKAHKRRTHMKGAVGSRSGTRPASGKQTKQQTCLDLLGRREGATIEELQVATGWQKHSVRGFLAGAVRKKLGLTLISEKPDAGPRRYRILTMA